MNLGIIEVDLHGMDCREAKKCIDGYIKKANSGTYYIRLVHGYRGGTRIREMIFDEYSYGRSSKVKRIKPGNNPGVTDLVLREL